jgi:tetratricopeptide (TPR) repeat protein
MKVDLALADAEGFAKDTLTRIRKNLGTDLVVLGSYVSLAANAGTQIRVDLRVQDAAGGVTIASVTETGTESELLTLVSRIGSALRDKLGVGELSATQAAGIKALLPSDPAAARAYTEGLRQPPVVGERHRAGPAREGGDRRARLSARACRARRRVVCARLRREGGRRSQTAFELSDKLSRKERLSIEGQYRKTAAELDKATEIYRTLFNFFPDNLEYGLRLADVQVSAGKGKDALATLDRVRACRLRYARTRGSIWRRRQRPGRLRTSRNRRRRRREPVEKGAAQDARILRALARIAQGDGYLGLGDPAKAIAAFEDAQRIYTAAAIEAASPAR